MVTLGKKKKQKKNEKSFAPKTNHKCATVAQEEALGSIKRG